MYERLGGAVFGYPPPTRYEDARRGLADVFESEAALKHAFVYTNTELGWFLSSFEVTHQDESSERAEVRVIVRMKMKVPSLHLS